MELNKTILIIGFGSIGKRHTNNILRTTKSNVVVFSHRSNIKPKEFYNYQLNKKRIKIFSKINECLKEFPSVGFITNETSFHIDFAIKLAKHKIHLFIEKPLSNSIKKIDQLEQLVHKNNLIVMVGCNFRFYPPIKKIKKLVETNIVGNIVSVQCENGSYLPDWHPDEDYSKSYASRKELGGGVTLTQIHELDYLTWIFGDVKTHQSIVGKFSHLKVNSDDLCTCILQLKNNTIVELHLDYFSKPFYKRLKIRGTAGILYWNSDENKIKFFNNETNNWKIIHVSNNYKLTGRCINQMYVNELKYFLKYVQNKKQPMNNLNESLKVLKTTLNLKS